MKKVKKRHSSSRRKLKKQSKLLIVLKAGRFLPAIVLTLLTSTLAVQPYVRVSGQHAGVLAYATNVTTGGLLSSTNTQRSNNGVASLGGNGLLTTAAQNKAEDMVARDYWSHTTPDGQQPWVFIDNAGYKYTAAGENLAYGFMTSESTVTGWMNSQAHKDNLLNSTFTEVGFGIANGANYVGTGQQTVVVAMYGKPQVQSASTPAPVASAPKSTPKAVASAPAPTPAPIAEKVPVVEPTLVEPTEHLEQEEELIATTPSSPSTDLPVAAPASIQRIQILTRGTAAWSTTAVILGVSAVGLLWIVHRGFHIRKYILAGEHFLAHHVHLDMTVLAVVYLGFVLLSTSGAVR
ncbi:CAP domain-containing protein [Candidatus Saccharibacteria bacterium]|nr:CAP domain-containing protein [Candidatus Saccharibacteria bacterium]